MKVVVIGFGPCGAVASALLGQAGFEVLALDRSVEIYPKPRAMAVDHEIMRLFDNLGVAGAVLPLTAPFPASEHFGVEGQIIRRVDMVPPPYPLGYTPTMTFSQPPVEAALRAHATATPGVTVELGRAVTAVTEAGAVTLDDGRLVQADWVVACDGASSPTRQALGIALDDLVFDEPWLVVDLLLTGTAPGLPANAAQFCDPARPISYIPGPGAHRRFEIMLLPGEDAAAMQQEARVWPLLARWLGPEVATLWRAASYRFHALVAREWRVGKVFLAGDAAHQQPPFIGQGMCQGLRDVANLAWKLAAVRDGADPALLDSYGVERGAHVRALTERIKAIGRQICERDPAAARARDAALLAQGGGAPPVVTRQEIVPPLATGFLDHSGHPAVGTLFPQPALADGTLLDRRHGHGWRLFSAVPAPGAIDLEGLGERDGILAGWFARHGVGAALVRPDHYVWGVDADPSALAARAPFPQATPSAMVGCEPTIPGRNE